MLLMSFYNIFTFWYLSFGGDFGTYCLIIIFKLIVCIWGLSCLRSKNITEHRVFIAGLAVCLGLDVGLIVYDLASLHLNSFFQFFATILDLYLFYISFALERLIRGKLISL